MQYLKSFVSGILAGICIAFGGVVFLSLDNKILGALFFTVGLFTVCSFGFSLFTGRVCYVFKEKRAPYTIKIFIMWFGNLVGTAIIAGCMMLTRAGAGLREKAIGLCEPKLSDNLLSLFILGIFCNIFIYIAVEGYKNIEHQLGKYLALFFGVMVFILSGFEHCIADMFYFFMGGAWSGHTVLVVVIISLGNALGGIILPTLRDAVAQRK